MVVTCDKCGKEFQKQYFLERHIKRKFPCFSVDYERRRKAVKGDEKTAHTNRCTYCNIECKKKHLNKHYRNTCKFIPENKRNFFIEKYKENGNHIKNSKTLAITNSGDMKIDQSTHNDNSTHNSTHNDNSTQINSNNDITNNITNNQNNTFNLNTFGNEDTSYMTFEDKLEVLNKGHNGLQLAFEKIYYKNDRNRTMFQQNKNKPYVHCLKDIKDVSSDDDSKILSFDYIKLDDAKEKAYYKLADVYVNWYDDVVDKLPNNYKKRNATKVRDKFVDGDKEMEEKCNEDFGIFVYKVSNKIKSFYKTLKKDGKIINFI